MAVKSLYFKNVTTNGALSLQDGGTAPTAALSGTGWTVAKLATPNLSVMAAGVKRSGTFTTADPMATASFSAGSCWRSENPLIGAFANTSWSMAFRVRASSSANAQTGAIKVRVWRSKAADGTGAVQITSALLTGTTTAVLSTSASGTSTVTWATPGVQTFDNDYLWVQCEWSIVATGGANGCDSMFYIESAGVITTPDFVAAAFGTGALANTGNPSTLSGAGISRSVNTAAALAAQAHTLAGTGSAVSPVRAAVSWVELSGVLPGGAPVETVVFSATLTGNDPGYGDYTIRSVFPVTGMPDAGWLVLIGDNSAVSSLRVLPGQGTINGTPGFGAFTGLNGAFDTYNHAWGCTGQVDGTITSVNSVKIRGSGSARQICARLEAHSTLATNFDHVSMGIWRGTDAAANAWGYGGTTWSPIELKWGGATGISIPAGTMSAYSDWVPFPEDTVSVFGVYRLNSGNGGWANLTLVQIIAAADLAVAAGGTHARLITQMLNFAVGQTFNAYIGQQAISGNAYSFKGTPSRFTWGGAGTATSDGVNLTFRSDFVALPEPFDKTKNYCVAIEYPTGPGGAVDIRYDSVFSITNEAVYKGGMDAATVVKSGYLSTGLGAHPVAVEEIDVIVVLAVVSGTGALAAQSSTLAGSGSVSTVSVVTGTGTLSLVPRINLVLQSQTFDLAPWSTNGLTITPDFVAAPDGTMTAERFVDTTANTNHLVGQQVSVALDTPHTFSVYAKAGTLNWLQIFANGSSNTICFDLATGALGTASGPAGAAHSITAVGNGWYRCSITSISGSESPYFYILTKPADDAGLTVYAGTGNGSVYLWGAQLEPSSVPTGYSPTTDAVVNSAGSPALLSGIGSVVTPPVTGTGVLTTSVAALVAPGIAASTGTSILVAQDRTMAGLGASQSVQTSAAPVAGVSTLAGAGFVTIASENYILVASPGPTYNPIGTNAAQKVAQTFIAIGPTISLVRAFLQKQSNPTDSLQVKIFTVDASHLPLTQVGVTSTTVLPSVIPAPGFRPDTPFDFTFSTPVPVTKDTEYAFVLERSAALSDTRYYFYNITTGAYPAGQYSVFNGSTWTAGGASDDVSGAILQGGIFVPVTGTGSLTSSAATLPGSGISGSTGAAAGGASSIVITGDIANTGFYATGDGGLFNQVGQTFIAAGSSIPKVQLMLNRYGSPTGLVLASIYTANASHLPLAQIGTSSVPCSTLVADPGRGLVEFVFSPPVSVTPGTEYIVVTTRDVLEDYTKVVNFVYYFTGDSYPAGQLLYNDGSGWLSAGGTYDQDCIISFAAVGGLLSSSSTLAGAGSVGTTVSSGVLAASAASISAVGVATSLSTSAALLSSASALLGSGISRSVSTLAVLAANPGGLTAAGVSRSVSTSATLSAAAAAAASTGLSSTTGTGTLAPSVATLAGVGLNTSTGTGALASSVAALSGSGVARWVATGALTSVAALSGTGTAQWIATATLNAQSAAIVGPGLARWVGTGALNAGVAALAGAGISSSQQTLSALQVTVASISGFEGVTIISGTGTMPSQSATLAGVAVSRSQGTGSLLTTASAAAGAGLSGSQGASLLVPAACAINGLGQSASSGTAALSAGAASVTGVGSVAAANSGILIVQGAAVAGSGNVIWTATGNLSAPASALAGVGLARWSALGTLSAGAAAVAGVGLSSSSSTSAALLAAQASVFGAEGVVVIQGTGALQAQSRVIAGVGSSRSTGAGSLSVPDSSVLNGPGTSGSIAVGTLVPNRAILAGTGAGEILGTAAIVAAGASLNATGVSRWVGAGAISAQSASVSGVGVVSSAGTGVLQDGVGSLVGAGVVSSTGQGVLLATVATAFGSGDLATRGSGDLVAQDRVITGVGLGLASGSGVLRSGSTALEADGISRSLGSGAVAARPALVTGFASLTAYGVGVLTTGDARIAANDLVYGQGVIVSSASEIAGAGEVGEYVAPPPTELPGGYPGTVPYLGAGIEPYRGGGAALHNPAGIAAHDPTGIAPWRRVA